MEGHVWVDAKLWLTIDQAQEAMHDLDTQVIPEATAQ